MRFCRAATGLGQSDLAGPDVGSRDRHDGDASIVQRADRPAHQSARRGNSQKSVQEMRAKAQVAIDILVRNLFERTADIGFWPPTTTYADSSPTSRSSPAISTPPRISMKNGKPCAAASPSTWPSISVYSDIVLLDIAGTVLARLDDSIAVGQSAEPMLQEALSTAAAYVESCGNHDLLPGGPR